MKNIKELSTWDSAETTVKNMGFDRVTMLEPNQTNYVYYKII